jgi:protein-disulfide isomerase
MTLHNDKPTRSQQREIARAKARELREQHKKGQRNKKILLQVGVVAAVLGVAALVVALATSGGNGGAATNAEPKNFTFNDGLKLGTNLEAFTPTATPSPAPGTSPATVPNIVIYLDYQCPICQMFEVPNQSQIESWVKDGKATLEIHPISFLDGRGSPNEYSSRAANAAICVAEYSPSQFFKYNSVLFENQPAELTNGPENSELIARAKEVGVSNADKIASCINAKSYGTWLSLATARALSEKIPGTDLQVDGTPFILVNGQQYTFETNDELTSPARFAQFLQTVSNN